MLTRQIVGADIFDARITEEDLLIAMTDLEPPPGIQQTILAWLKKRSSFILQL